MVSMPQRNKHFEQFENDDELHQRLGWHYTDRNAMDNASLPEQHDNFQQQLSNFQRLLQHAINKFSTEKLNHMLRAVSKGISMSARDDYPKPISSLRELQDMVDEIKDQTTLKNSMHKGDDMSLAKYFEAFFDDLEYLRSLKRNFDEKIYVCLYDYFYDPLDEMDILSVDEDGEESGKSGVVFDRNKALLKVSDKAGAVDGMNDKEKLSFAVSELFIVNQKWERLFDEDAIDAECFDEDSIHELRQYDDYALYENVLRIVPDIFVKEHRSIELAKLWWTQANKVYSDLPKQGGRDIMLENKEKEIKQKIDELRSEITSDEEAKRRLEEEFKVLTQREEKLVVLSDVCETMEIETKELERRHNDILVECADLNEQMKNVEKLSKDFQVIDYQLKAQEKELACVKNELQSASYKLKINQSDLDWKMQIRPDMIFFKADVGDRINCLEEDVVTKTVKKRQYEKKLTLLRTNCERMRQIMRRYIKSVDVHESNARRQKVMANMKAKYEPSTEDTNEDQTLPRMEVIVSDGEEEQGRPTPRVQMKRVKRFDDDDVFESSGVEDTPPKERHTKAVDTPTGTIESPDKVIRTRRKQKPPSSVTMETKHANPQQSKRTPFPTKSVLHPDVLPESTPSTRQSRRRRSLRSEKALLYEDDVHDLPPVVARRGSRSEDTKRKALRIDRGSFKSTSTDRTLSQLHSNYSQRSAFSSSYSPTRNTLPSAPTTTVASSRLSQMSKFSSTHSQLQSPTKSGSGQLAHRATGAKKYYMRFKHHRTNDSILNRKPFPKQVKKEFVDIV